MILGMFWMATANAAALLGAHALLRRLHPDPAPTDLLLFLLLRLVLISAAVLAAGLLGILTPLALGLAGTASLAALLALGEHRRLERIRIPAPGRVVLLICCFAGTRLLFQAWFFAPYVEDALSYHLPKIAEWVRAQAIVPQLGPDARSPFPAGFELVETWWVVFLRHDVGIEGAGIEFLLLAVAATYALARTLGLEPRGAWLAAAVYALTPTLSFQATASLNDGPAAALILATMALILSKAPWGLILLAAGMGIGIKPTYLFALPGFALLALLVGKIGPHRVLGGRSALVLGGIGAAVGLSWYLRNAILWGSPIHPMGSEGFLLGPSELPKQQLGPSLSSLRDNFICLIDARLHDPAAPQGALGASAAGWGAGAFACGLPALTAWLRESGDLRRLAAAMGTALFSVLALVSLDPWCMRFALFFPALLALAAARAAMRSKPAAVALGLALLLQAAATFIPAELPRAELRMLSGLPWKARTVMDAGRYVPSGEPVALLEGTFGGRIYCLYGADFGRKVILLKARTVEELRDGMAQEGASVLYGFPSPLRIRELLEEGVRREVLVPLGENFFRRRTR